MSRTLRMKILAVALLSCSVALAGCGKPKIPDHDDRPEPKAAPAAQPPTALRQTMQQPTAAAERQRDDALNAATGE